MQPLTPQRTASHHKQSHSVSVSFPQGLSPASPYTPLSLRSFASASTSSSGPSPSSTLATPASVRNLNIHAGFTSPPVGKTKRISWASPSPAGQSPDSLPSLADLARNWRSKASENGIRVSTNGKQSLGDDYSFDDGDGTSSCSLFFRRKTDAKYSQSCQRTCLRRRRRCVSLFLCCFYPF